MARALFSRKRLTYQQSIWHSYPGPAVSPEHKVILLGVAGVGKTSYFLRVRDGAFVSPESTCFPADFLEKKVEVSASDDFAIKVDHSSLAIPSYNTLALCTHLYRSFCSTLLGGRGSEH